jgi:hypothetical protein
VAPNRLVEILHSAGCPNVEKAGRVVQEALAEASLVGSAEVRVIEVTDEHDAKRLRFLGSPTIRVDGKDVDQAAADRDDFGLQCRVYDVEGRITRCPPASWIAVLLKRNPG